MQAKTFHYVGYSISSALIIFLFYGIGTAMILHLLPESIRNEWQTQLLGLSQILFILIPTLLVAKWWPLKVTSLHFNPANILSELSQKQNNKVMKLPKLLRLDKFPDAKQIGYSLLALMMFQVFMAGYAEVQNALIPDFMAEIYDKYSQMVNQSYSEMLLKGGFLALIGSLFYIALIPAVCEEFLMRGMLQKSLEEAINPSRAIIITGLIFGFVHFNPIQLVPLILIGFMLGFAAYITKSLYTSIIMHLVNNAFTVLMLTYFLDPDSPDVPLSMLTAVSFSIFGGLTVFFFCYKLYIYSLKKNLGDLNEIS